MVVAEEYIEYYADKYKELTRKHKFAMPLCKCTDKNKLYNAIKIVKQKFPLSQNWPFSTEYPNNVDIN